MFRGQGRLPFSGIIVTETAMSLSRQTLRFQCYFKIVAMDTVHTLNDSTLRMDWHLIWNVIIIWHG
jgi:hypothetical protein